MERSNIVNVAVDFLSETRGILRHKWARDAGLLTASQYVAAGLGFFTTAVAARLLGPREYGVAAMVVAYPALLWSFVGTKSTSVATRYIAIFRTTGHNDELK